MASFMLFLNRRSYSVFGYNCLYSFLDLAGAQAACDCETECSCSKSNCTAGQYWLSDGGCVECPAGHL